MSCPVNLRTDLLQGAPTGGSWQYAGYHPTSASGSPGSGGSSVTVGSGDNPSVNFTGFAPGFYFFDYFVGGFPCNSTQRTYVQVAPYPNAGSSNSATYCTDHGFVVNLADIISGEESGGTWSVVTGNPPPGSFNAAAGTFSLSQVNSPGLYQFQYSITVQPPSGVDLADCADCTRTSLATVQIQEGGEAGSPTTINLCPGESVELFAEHNANNGGNLTNAGDFLFMGWNDDLNGFNTSQTFTVNGITASYAPFSVLSVVPCTLSNLPNGYYYMLYRVGSSPCNDSAQVTVIVADCNDCPDDDNCYQAPNSSTTFWGFVLNDGTVINGSTPGFDFPYSTSSGAAGAATLQSHLQAWLDNNGGGTVSVVYSQTSDGGNFWQITVNNPCVGFSGFCTGSSCDRPVAFNTISC